VKHARFTPAAVVELEDAARRVDRARPGSGDKLNDEVLEALERIEEYVEVGRPSMSAGPSAGSCSIPGARSASGERVPLPRCGRRRLEHSAR
jgi:hypothetical protein